MLPSMIDAPAYGSPTEHLRDELWRCWLRVEYQVRRSWELGTLPRVSDEASSGIWAPSDMAGIFRAAQAEFTGAVPDMFDAGATLVRDAFAAHSSRVDARLAA